MNDQFTYNGVTVSYTEAQKAIILADQNLITTLQNDLANYKNSYNFQEGLINEAKDHLDNECNRYYGARRTNCQAQWNNQWDNARANQATIIGYIDTNNSQSLSATKKLNDDLIVIQNDIKLQIQTQLANTAAATAAANNQVNVSTAPTNAAAANEQALADLQNKAEAERLKSERQTKMFTFGAITLVIIVIAVLIIKKVS